MRAITISLAIALTGLWPAGCADDTDKIAPNAEDRELGKSLFDPLRESDEKADSLKGLEGLPVGIDGEVTAVWEVRNAWTDTDTAAARKSGMAWGENSGLTWDEKYSRWVESMVKVDSQSYFKTYEMTTPYGKTLPAPAIECAETALFLRATFASWFQLPFFIEARDRHGKRLFLGHFGFRTESSKYANSPNFRSAYKDHSDLGADWQTRGWPQDARLRGRKLGGSQDDYQPFLFDGARAGAYFDELFLNKRVGYFMVYLLSYFGSVNLADPSNLYNLDPRAIKAGDVLLERWQRRGIGHTLVVKTVSKFGPEQYEVELISGSMPRRQGKWEAAAASKSYFLLEETGGEGTNDDDDRYAKLGGGVKRWRVASNVSGRWTNVVMPADRDHFIDATQLDAIAARPGIFEQILTEVPPEQKIQVLVERIADQRQHLRNYPASCSARIRREDAMTEMYELQKSEFGRSHAETDAMFRKLEDFALPELEYEKSKTCCWNSSTAAMFEIILQRAVDETRDHTTQSCKMPTGFYARNGGYDDWQAYSVSIGRGDQWVRWSEDESCPQRDVENDTEAQHNGSSWCEVGHAVLNPGANVGGVSGGATGSDAFEPNETRDNAADLPMGSHSGLTLCEDDEDWYMVTVEQSGNLEITLSFAHTRGDIDLGVYDAAGDKLAESTTTSDVESISESAAAGKYFVNAKRYGDGDDCQPYEMNVSVR